MGGAVETLMDNMDKMQTFYKMFGGEAPMISTNGTLGKPLKKANPFGLTVWAQYHFDLRCRNFITEKVTKGWLAAAGKMQDELLKQGKEGKQGTKPTLLLWTDGDTCLNGKELEERAKCLSKNLTTKFVPKCRHDMLLNYTKDDNNTVMDAIFGFLKAN